MAKADYRRALKTAERDMVRLEAERERITRQIAETRQTIIALRQSAKIDGHPTRQSFVPTTLTEAVTFAFLTAKIPLYPVAIRDRIYASGFTLTSSNPLASIHSVVKRLTQQGHVLTVFRTDPKYGFHPFDRGLWWSEYKPPKGWVFASKEEYQKVIETHFPHFADLTVRQQRQSAQKREKEE